MNDNPHFADADCSEWWAGPWLIALGGRDAAGREYRLGTREYGWHQHVRGQLLCVESGLLHVRTAHGDWVLPPQRAGWIPPATQHRVQVLRRAERLEFAAGAGGLQRSVECTLRHRD